MPGHASGIQTLFDNVRIDDDPTTLSSDAIEIGAWTRFLLYLNIDSTASPSSLQVIVEFSDDGGTTWFPYKNDFWGNLLYNATQTASGLREAVSGIAAGSTYRVRLIGSGTDASNYFDVTIKAEFFNT